MRSGVGTRESVRDGVRSVRGVCMVVSYERSHVRTCVGMREETGGHVCVTCGSCEECEGPRDKW